MISRGNKQDSIVPDIEECKPLRFHWSLSKAGDKFRGAVEYKELNGLLNFDDQLNLCLLAEKNGIDSMLMAIGFSRPDPLLLTLALGQETQHINFMVAVRSGLISPAYFVQQLNTLSTIIGDRIHVNVVSGHTPGELKYYGDFLEHDERYTRTMEFLEVCHTFWDSKSPVNFHGSYFQVENGAIETPFNSEIGRPEIYVGGNSNLATGLTCKHGDCQWRFPDTAKALKPKILPVLAAGKEVGLMASIIVRPTQDDAELAARQLLRKFASVKISAHEGYKERFDSHGFKEILDDAFNNHSKWITPFLWNGAVPYLGAPAIAFVGSYEHIAKVLLNYKKAGITQFLFMGWPDEEEIEHFGQGLLPLIRIMEEKEEKKFT